MEELALFKFESVEHGNTKAEGEKKSSAPLLATWDVSKSSCRVGLGKCCLTDKCGGSIETPSQQHLLRRA